MAKRISDISRIQDYFETAPIEAAKLAQEVVQGIMRRRAGVTATPRKTRTDKGLARKQDALPLKEATA